jgi:hypothetical protein
MFILGNEEQLACASRTRERSVSQTADKAVDGGVSWGIWTSTREPRGETGCIARREWEGPGHPLFVSCLFTFSSAGGPLCADSQLFRLTAQRAGGQVIQIKLPRLKPTVSIIWRTAN